MAAGCCQGPAWSRPWRGAPSWRCWTRSTSRCPRGRLRACARPAPRCARCCRQTLPHRLPSVPSWRARSPVSQAAPATDLGCLRACMRPACRWAQCCRQNLCRDLPSVPSWLPRSPASRAASATKEGHAGVGNAPRSHITLNVLLQTRSRPETPCRGDNTAKSAL